MEIRLRTCTIRDFRRGDEESLARAANNRRIWINLRDRFPHPYTLDDAVSWVASAGSGMPLTDFAIVVDGLAVGAIGFVLRDDIFRKSAELGYWLGEEYWGRGVMSEAVPAMTAYAFEAFELCRIYAGILEWNPASARVLEKSGYRFEGRMKKAAIKDGRIIDELIYAITR